MKSAQQFRTAVRGSVRVGRPSLVVHATTFDDDHQPVSDTQIGFVVSKKVGNAVTRNRVKRRMRHIVRERLAETPPVWVVVRALPTASTSPHLADDLESAWDQSLERLGLT